MIEFEVPAMSCSHCASTITTTVLAVDPQARVEVDLNSKKVKIQSVEAPARLSAALTDAGYPPSGV